MPELVEEGVTGTLVANVADAAAAVGRVATYDRRAVRSRSIHRFNSDRMIDQYVAAYDWVVAGAHRSPQPIGIAR
jgi:hypothetical protein